MRTQPDASAPGWLSRRPRVFSLCSRRTARPQRSISMQPLVFLTARSSACPARGTLGGPPGRGSGAGARRPGSPRHGVRPRATTRDPGAATTPRVLCCSRRDAGLQQSLLPARAGLGSGKEGGCALYRVAWGQPPLGPLLGLRAGLRSPLVRVGSLVQVAWGAQPASIWVLRPLSAPHTLRPPTQLR